ncbi:hypothetical protein Dimus_037242 [Dionaea muscipula]
MSMDVDSSSSTTCTGGGAHLNGKSKEPTTPGTDDHCRSRRCGGICVVGSFVFTLMVVILVILGWTVLKVRRPVTTVNSVSLQDFQFSLGSLPQINPKINLTLAADVSIKNPNILGMKYTNSSAYVGYRGGVVGQAPLPAGSISGGQTLPLNLTITFMADRLISNSQFLSDVVSNGTLPLTAYTQISGKVSILFFKIHVVSYTTCHLVISVANRNISSNDCI